MNENINLDNNPMPIPEEKPNPFPQMEVKQTTDGPVVVQKTKKLNIPKFNFGSANKLFKIMVILLIVILILSVALFFAGFGLDTIRNMNKNKGNGVEATPTATPMSVINSKYASDEDMILINQRIKELQTSLNDAKFRDDNLRIPSVDWEINFEN